MQTENHCASLSAGSRNACEAMRSQVNMPGEFPMVSQQRANTLGNQVYATIK